MVKRILDFENFVNEAKEHLALLITIPKTIKWEDYLKEIDTVKDSSQEMNFKVSSKPTKVSIGDRCYICHNGFIKGWMQISNIEYKDAFDCSTTGEHWDEGWYVSRSGEFHKLDKEISQKGFQGYRYIKEI